LCAIAGGLSRSLKADVLGFLVHDSDIAQYWLYRNGKLTDEFNSAPDYFTEVNEQARERVRGDAEILLRLCLAGTTRAQLDEVLHPADGPPVMAEDIVTELSKLLGIDESRAIFGFEYFEEEGAESLPDVEDFEPIGRGLERKRAKPHENAGANPMLDSFPLAINMLTQAWNDELATGDQGIPAMFGRDTAGMARQMREMLDKHARDLLKKSALPGRPSLEALKTARDQGPDALAALIAEKTPGQLTEIGVGAATVGLEAFLAALLECGLNPSAASFNGRTTLTAAAQHGTDSSIYRLAKAADDRRALS
jgi:hypothetical protein